jgi:hypothetical protein
MRGFSVSPFLAASKWLYGSESVTKVSSRLMTLMSGPKSMDSICDLLLFLRGGNSLASKHRKAHGRSACQATLDWFSLECHP